MESREHDEIHSLTYDATECNVAAPKVSPEGPREAGIGQRRVKFLKEFHVRLNDY